MPIQGEYYLHDGKVYRVDIISRGTDEITLSSVEDGAKWSVRYSVFKYGFKRVWKTGDVAKMLEISPRSIYRHESNEVIPIPTRYKTIGNNFIRFYTMKDIFVLREMIAGVHQGRPRKDKRIVNNKLPNEAYLRQYFRERFGETSR